MGCRLPTRDEVLEVLRVGHIVSPATGSNVAICGWWDGRRLLQDGSAQDNPYHLGSAHSHADYGTVTMLVRDPAPPEPA